MASLTRWASKLACKTTGTPYRTLRNNRQPADVVQRQAIQPYVIATRAQIEERAKRVPPVVPVGERNRLSPACCSRCKDDAVELIEPVLWADIENSSYRGAAIDISASPPMRH